MRFFINPSGHGIAAVGERRRQPGLFAGLRVQQNVPAVFFHFLPEGLLYFFMLPVLNLEQDIADIAQIAAFCRTAQLGEITLHIFHQRVAVPHTVQLSGVEGHILDTAAPLEKLIEEFSKFPGIGRKGATRMAYQVLSMSDEDAAALAGAIQGAHTKLHRCRICQNYTEADICPICASAKRDPSVICVVETPRDVQAFERTREYHGLYHVLHGLLSPMDGITAEQLCVKELLARLGDGKVKEVKVSTRLKDHPVCLSADGPLSIEMEKVLSKQPGSEGVKSDKVLELNVNHPVFAVLKAAQEAGDTDKVKKYSSLLYAQAQLIEGLPVDDPAAYAEAVCSLMK